MPSSSFRISLVYRARDCRCTVLVAGTRSLAVVGTRPGARNWLASAFSEEEVCRRGRSHQRGGTQENVIRAEEAEVPLLTSFSACSIPFRKSTLREYSLITSEAGLLDEETWKKETCPLSPVQRRSQQGWSPGVSQQERAPWPPFPPRI